VPTNSAGHPELWAAARQLNQYAIPSPSPRPAKRKSPKPSNRGLIGDRFNATATWEEILEPLGWTIARVKGNTTHWSKPHATKHDCHATTGYGEADCLYVFSSDCLPLKMGQAYSKFAAITFLQYDGDFQKSARAIKQNTLFGG
jgi:hypothetical protein